MEETPRQMRLSTTVRGIIITVLIALYSWIFKQSGGSLAVALLIGAAVQIAVVVVRRIVPAAHRPQTIHIVELIADGVTVLLFAVGVLGAISAMPEGV